MKKNKIRQCAQCHEVDTQNSFFTPTKNLYDYTWANIDGGLQLLCWACTDKLHKASMALDKAWLLVSDIPSQNVDYIH